MAKTQISDVVIPSNFEDYIFERTAVTSAFFASGVITNHAELALPDGGREVEMPFWQDLGSTEEDLSDSGSLTPEAITTGQQTARMQYLGKAWSVNDLAKWIAGDDPVQNLANNIGDFWARVYNFRLMAALNGFFRSATGGANSLNVALLASGNTLTGETFADALDIFGDKKSVLRIVAMHSAVHTALAKADLISTERDKDNDYDFDSFGGRRVVMDDSLPFNGVHSIAVDLSVDATTEEIRDAADGFITAGFEVGDTIITTNFADAANNDTFTIAAVVAGAITVKETGILTDVAAEAANVDSVGTYTTYLFAPGSVGFGRGAMGSEAFENDRDILAGDLTSSSRSRIVMHPAGARFLSATVAGAGPTRAELELPLNWSRTVEAKNSPIVQLRHRI